MLQRIALAAVATLLLLGGTAHASSLVYVKDHNVWVANPDGSGQRQLTTNGLGALPYESPSQADDGTILAIRGERFVKLDRLGRRIGAPLPSILVGRPPNAYAFGPFSAKISPDGTKLAYGIGTLSTWFDHGTNTTWTDPKEAVIWQDAVTGAQLGFTMFYEDPSWLQDSARALINNSGNRNAPQIALAGIGQNHNDVLHVFSDHDSRPAGEVYSMDVADPEATPAGDKIAALRGARAETIRFYDLRGGRPVVAPCHFAEPVGGSFAGPTWSPDGGALAWAEADGIWASPVGPLDTTDCATFGAPRLIIPGGY